MKTKKLISLTFLLCFALNLAAQNEQLIMPKLFIGVNYEPMKIEKFSADGPQTHFLFGIQPIKHLRIESYFGGKYNFNQDGFGSQGLLMGIGAFIMAQHKSLNFSIGYKMDITGVSARYQYLTAVPPYQHITKSDEYSAFSKAFLFGFEYFINNQFSVGAEFGLKKIMGNSTSQFQNFYYINILAFTSLNMRYHFPMKDAN
jgi:hypothetical protein